MPDAPPGWYADPFDSRQVRWWDGAQWLPFARPRHQHRQTGPRHARWVVPLVAGSLVVLLTACITIGAVEVLVVRKSLAEVAGTDALQQLVLPDSTAPQGTKPDPGAPTALGTAGSDASYAVQRITVIPDACLALQLGQPVRAADAHSKDPVQPLATFSGNTSTADGLWVQATARRFSSVAAAEQEVRSMTWTVRTCSAGFATALFTVSDVRPATAHPEGIGGVGWTATLGEESNPTAKQEVLDFRLGSIVVRASCIVPGHSGTVPERCQQWWPTIALDLEHMHTP